MKTLGLLGGMSWVSTAEYYRRLNELAYAHGGGNCSFPCLIYSFDFSELAGMMARGETAAIGRILAERARTLEQGGAEAILIGTNTMHRHADEVAAAVGVPLLHIVDALVAEIRRRGWGKVGLLGTRPTMSEKFFAGRLQEAGIEVVSPCAEGQEGVHRAIFEELTQNRFLESTRRMFLGEIESLAAAGAEACILGCTEIPLLLDGVPAAVPLVDSTACHCRFAFEWAVG